VRFILQSATPLLPHDSEVLRILLNAEPFEVVDSYAAPRGTPSMLTPLGTLFLPLDGLIDVAAELERLTKEMARVEEELAKVRAKLANPNFAGKVPPAASPIISSARWRGRKSSRSSPNARSAGRRLKHGHSAARAGHPHARPHHAAWG